MTLPSYHILPKSLEYFNPHAHQGMTPCAVRVDYPTHQNFNPHAHQGMTPWITGRIGCARYFNPHAHQGMTLMPEKQKDVLLTISIRMPTRA